MLSLQVDVEVEVGGFGRIAVTLGVYLIALQDPCFSAHRRR